MLPRVLRSENQLAYEHHRNGGPLWDAYLTQIGDYAESVHRDFLSQICFDHFDNFDGWFPGFDINEITVLPKTVSAQDVYDNVRRGDRLETHWRWQVNEQLERNFPSGNFVLQHCLDNDTWPSPPVIVDSAYGATLGGTDLGTPWHLVEGTHRVSYITRLLELGRIVPIASMRSYGLGANS
jgi:hypothetical protein